MHALRHLSFLSPTQCSGLNTLSIQAQIIVTKNVTTNSLFFIHKHTKKTMWLQFSINTLVSTQLILLNLPLEGTTCYYIFSSQGKAKYQEGRLIKASPVNIIYE